MGDLCGQDEYGIRLDWGPTGAQAICADLAVVVDVLSFSTTVTVAVERGMRVFPFRWNDSRAAEFATANDAVLAVGRLEATRGDRSQAPTLSPSGLLDGPVWPRLVLPSPNGSTIAAALQAAGATVAVGCLRNASAVASWLAAGVADGHRVAVVAAGERWSRDNSLRPSLEDHLGAGAILSALATLAGGDGFSPEASVAADLFEASRGRLVSHVQTCVGGRELAAKGFAADVALAADLDASTVVPVLIQGAFEESVRRPGSALFQTS